MLEKNCLEQCRDLMISIPSGKIIKVFNRKSPFGSNPSFCLNHLNGCYTVHYVVEDCDYIFDPFLKEPIVKKEYLERVYKNHE